MTANLFWRRARKTAHGNLSFNEKVNFARQLQDHGYDRKVICDALSVDKTLSSRMLNLADRLSPDLIELIGAAPSVGRDRWWALADMVYKTEADMDTLAAMVNLGASNGRSDLHVAAARDFLSGLATQPRPKPWPPRPGRSLPVTGRCWVRPGPAPHIARSSCAPTALIPSFWTICPRCTPKGCSRFRYQTPTTTPETNPKEARTSKTKTPPGIDVKRGLFLI